MTELLLFSFLLQSFVQWVREQWPRLDGRIVLPVAYVIAVVMCALTPSLSNAGAELLALEIHSQVIAVLFTAALCTFGAKAFHSWQKAVQRPEVLPVIEHLPTVEHLPTPDDPDA